MDDAEPSIVDPTRSSPVRERGIPAPRELGRGTVVGRFTIVEELGAGAMGTVYGAYDPQLDRKVALKLLRPEAPASTEREGRLLREAQALGRLAHPNIVAVHDAGTWDDRTFLAMELVHGTTLRQWLKERPRSWQEILGVFAQAGRGLSAAHEAGLVHRDFKPDNVMVSPDGRVRVTDFGLARAAGAPVDDSRPGIAPDSPADPFATPLTRSGALVGTPAYMAPELLAGAPADARSDQFAFCVALHEALYGERPITTVNGDEPARSRRVAVPAGGAVPAWLGDVLARGLAARPADRFPSLAALLATFPADPERDLRVSDRVRAILLIAFAVLQAAVVGHFVFRGKSDAASMLEVMNGRAGVAWVAATLVLAGGVAIALRRRLLANRISRQLFLAMGILYYASMAGNMMGYWMGASAAAVSTQTLIWIGTCQLLLGLTLRPIFFGTGVFCIAAGVACYLQPQHESVVSIVTPIGLTVFLAAVWGRGRSGAAARPGSRYFGRRSRSPQASSQR